MPLTDHALDPIRREWRHGSISTLPEGSVSAPVRYGLAPSLADLGEDLRTGPPILLACPPFEHNESGLLALSCLLRERGHNVTYLGADVPYADLIRTATQLHPTAVCLSITSAGALPIAGVTARALLAEPWSLRLYVGGTAMKPFVTEHDVPGIRLPEPIGDAADLIERDLHDLAGTGTTRA